MSATCIDAWLEKPAQPMSRVLKALEPRPAVARGAAIYGRHAPRPGVRIRGGAARADDVGMESAMPVGPGRTEPPITALCVVPQGMEEGSERRRAGGQLGLVTGETLNSASSARPCAAATPWAPTVERPTRAKWRKLTPIEIDLPAKDERRRARWCRSASTPTSPRWARSTPREARDLQRREG